MMKKNIGLLILIPALVFVLGACTQTDSNKASSGTPSSTGSEVAMTSLQADPTESCNFISPSKKILINSPCDGTGVGTNSLTVNGKIINSVEDVVVSVVQNGTTVYTDSIYPVPSNAAGEFKLIQETINLTSNISGSATLIVEQEGDKVEVPVVF